MDHRFRIFQQVWALKSFSAAAAFLRMSQPNVTQQIKKLEQELGVRLFDRDTRSIRLTEAGKTVLAELPRLNAASEHLQRKLAGLGKGVRNYALGGTLTAGNFVLPRLMAGFMQLEPDVLLHLAIENTERITEKIQQGFVELALVEGAFDSSLFFSRKLADDELLATGTDELIDKNFSLKKYLKGNGTLLLREPGSGTRYFFDKFCIDHGIEVPPSQIITVHGFDAIKELAGCGTGITFISPLACRIERRHGILYSVRMKEGRIMREFNFLCSVDADKEFTSAFMDYCTKMYKQLVL